jgi:glycosyltransferase involved in cell wall biosynthesis
MKIALIAPSSIPSRRANSIQVMKMAQAITQLGHSVAVLSPAEPGKEKEPLPDWELLAGIYGLVQPFAFQILPSAPSLRRYDFSLRAVSWARQNNCDLVYTRLIQAAALSSSLGMPTILEVHDLPGGRIGPLIFRSFLRGRGARRLVVITRALADDLTVRLSIPPPGEAASGAFTVIAPDGVDLARFENLAAPIEARRSLNLFQDVSTFTAGYTGHLYAGRGIEFLINIAENLSHVNFLIVGGEPPDVERVKREIDRRNLKNILLTGFIPNNRLPIYQAACDVLLMPYQHKVAASSGGDISRYLSPMKLFEYLACERPILCSDLLVLREILDQEVNAILLPSQEIESWLTSLEALRHNPELRIQLAKQARETANHYTWESRAKLVLMNINPKQG